MDISTTTTNDFQNFFTSLELGQIYDGHSTEYLSFIDELDSFFSLKTILIEDELEEIILHSLNTALIIKSDQKYLIHNLLQSQLLNSQNIREVCLIDILCRYHSIKHNQKFNSQDAFLSFSLDIESNQFRCSMIHKKFTQGENHKIYLRKLGGNLREFNEFTSKENEQKLLQEILNRKENIIVAGATGSGKTTFLRSFLNQTLECDHLVTIEDLDELRLKRQNQTKLISENSLEQRAFCEYTLRLRPDRIVIGELRGQEIIPFVLSMNTGHKGCATTLHADNALEAIHRLATLFQLHQTGFSSYSLILTMLTRSIDYVVFLEEKSIKEIIHVKGSQENRVIYENLTEGNKPGEQAVLREII